MKPAVIYRRVSTTRQDEEGRSLRDQERELRQYARAMGYRIIGNFEDAVSGRREKTWKRAGLMKALELVCQKQATLIVYDLDRLARSQSIGTQIFERLKDCGAKLVVKSLGIDTNTPVGEMVLGIMFAVAQWGSRNIGEGVKRANRQTVAEKGYRTQGRQPFGYRIEDGQRIPDREEQDLIRTVQSIWREEQRCYNRTAVRLQNMGIPTPLGLRHGHKGVWNRESVRIFTTKYKPVAGT